MNDKFVKKYWPEESVLFYLHFKDGYAVEQVEVSKHKKTFLSLANPVENDSTLFDQSLEELDLNENDFIDSTEFYSIWNFRK